MVISPYSVRSCPAPLRKNEGATSTSASAAPVETFETAAEATSPAKSSLFTLALMGAGAAVALAVAIGVSAPPAPAPTVSVPSLVPGSTYKVKHVFLPGNPLRTHNLDTCIFTGPDNIKGPDSTYAEVTDKNGRIFTPDRHELYAPGAGTFELDGNQPVSNGYVNLTAESKATLAAIASYCQQTEEQISYITTVTIPPPK